MAVTVDWVRVWNRIFGVINNQGDECYFSEPRFIEKVRELDPYSPNYAQYMQSLREAARPTSRKDFFYKILREQETSSRKDNRSGQRPLSRRRE